MKKPRTAAEQPIFDYVMEKLVESKGRLPKVADESGVNYRTLQKIVQRETEDPGVSIIQKLADYFRAKEKAAA